MNDRAFFQLTDALVALSLYCLAMAPILAMPRETDELISYKVQKHDVLSRILRNGFGVAKLYGKDGGICKVAELNPDTVHKKGDLIRPNSIILIPKFLLQAKDVRKPAAEAVMSEGTATPPVAEPVKKALADIPSPKKTIEAGFSTLSFTFGTNFYALEGIETSNNTSGRLLSTLSPNLTIAWNQHWTDTTTSRIYISIEDIHIEPETTGLPITNANPLNTSFGIGAKTQVDEHLTAGADLEYGQNLFYHGLTGGGLEIDQVPLLRFHPNLSYTLAHVEPFTLEADAGASYWFSGSYGNYVIDAGLGYDLGLKIVQRFARSQADCGLMYGVRNQNTQYLEFSEKQTGFLCRLEWRPW